MGEARCFSESLAVNNLNATDCGTVPTFNWITVMLVFGCFLSVHSYEGNTVTKKNKLCLKK